MYVLPYSPPLSESKEESMNIQVVNNGRISYADALSQQEQYFRDAVAVHRSGRPAQHRLFFNEHHPVLTLGKHADPHNILFPKEALSEAGVEVYRTTRGGDVTYHGPGQWTVYPVFDLMELGLGVRDYVHALEEVAIRVLGTYDLVGERIHGASGVWMHTDTPMPRKVCAIGIKASHFITMHGIAFNVSVPPQAFHWINPCGFTDKGVTNLSLEVGHRVSMDEAYHRLTTAFSQVFDRPLEPLTP